MVRSRDRWCHVILIGQTRDSNTLRAQYLENSWRCYLATIANYLLDNLLWGSTVGYRIAIAWLLVLFHFNYQEGLMFENNVTDWSSSCWLVSAITSLRIRTSEIRSNLTIMLNLHYIPGILQVITLQGIINQSKYSTEFKLGYVLIDWAWFKVCANTI